MQLRIGPLNPLEAQEICTWHYEAPYDFYDMEADPEDLAEFLNPPAQVHQFAVRERSHGLIGFFTFVEEQEWIEVGLGLRPGLTGQGMGEDFVRQGLKFAIARFRPAGFRLAVAAFNGRAIKVYERVGFQTVRTFLQETNGGAYPFVEMALRVDA